MGLSAEQEGFLKECEDEFKDRFTEKDENFMEVKGENSKKPPIVDPWYGRPPRRDWNQRNQGRSRDGDRRNNYNSQGWKRNRDNSYKARNDSFNRRYHSSY